ncbi:MAG: PAS domain S-box protein, partial [Planctomycetota bacterium]
RKRRKRRIRRLNSLLRAIRNINRLIAEEKDLEELMREACRALSEARGYRHCGIALLDETTGQISPTAATGPEHPSTDFAVTANGDGNAPDCARATLKSREMEVRVPAEDCSDCDYGDASSECATVTLPLQQDDDFMGLLHVQLEKVRHPAESEINLLKEVARNLGFAWEKLKQERDLKKSERRFRTLVENLPGMAYRCRNEEGWPMEYCSSGCQALTGYAPGELTANQGALYGNLIHPDDREDVREKIRKAVENDRPFELEYRIHPHNGDEKWVLERGQAVEREAEGQVVLEGIITDITNRKMAEESLRKSEEKYRQIFNNANDAMYLHEIAEDGTFGPFVEVNDVACDMLGYDREEFRQMVPADIDADYREEQLPDIRARLMAEKEVVFDVDHVTRDGSTIPVEVNSHLVNIGREQRVLSIARDITERKQAEEELRQAYEQLRKTQRQLVEQERRRALTTMASGIAHNFNNALSTIRGFTDLLLQSPENLEHREKATDYLEYVRKAADNAAETVQRMRKFYRPSENEGFAPLDVNNLVEEAVSMTRPRWEEQARAEGADVEVKKDLGDIPDVRGNEAELHEMLTNLVFNAVDAMPGGGTLSFRTRQRGDQLMLEISDTGEGMSEEEQARCLDPFFTTKTESGAGLGLSTVSGIVKRHEGQIEVRSEKGEGTTVRIILPATEQVEADDTQRNKHDTGHLKVLVAEDEPQQRELMEEYLRMDDHQVNTAPDGQKGLTEFMDGYYDLVITDRSMPELNGDRLAREIKKEAPETPVIMMTGFGDMMDAAEEKVEGVDLVVSKPVSQDKLREAIADLMPGQAVIGDR